MREKGHNANEMMLAKFRHGEGGNQEGQSDSFHFDLSEECGLQEKVRVAEQRDYISAIVIGKEKAAGGTLIMSLAAQTQAKVSFDQLIYAMRYPQNDYQKESAADLGFRE